MEMREGERYFEIFKWDKWAGISLFILFLNDPNNFFAPDEVMSVS